MQYLIISGFFRLLGGASRKRHERLGRILGAVWFRVDRRHRKIALDNLTRSFGGEKTPAEIEAIARKVFANLARIIFEVAWTTAHSRKDCFRIVRMRGLNHFRDAWKKGKGVLAMTAHTGNWELLSIASGLIEYPVNILYRPLDFVPLDAFFVRFRTRFGTRVIPTRRAMRDILKCLSRGEVAAMLMDQNVDWYEGAFLGFFGRRACTNKGMALLAMKTGAPVVPAFMIREGEGFTVEYLPEIPLIKTGDKTRDVEENTRQYNQAIEAFIRRYPDQWLWLHQRWKTRPYQPWPRKPEVTSESRAAKQRRKRRLARKRKRQKQMAARHAGDK